MKLQDKPLFTQEFADSAAFRPKQGSAYIYRVSKEARSEFAEGLQDRSRGVRFVRVVEEDRYRFGSDHSACKVVNLRNERSVTAFLNSLPEREIYVDITGLAHPTWAALVRVAVRQEKLLRVVYVEPRRYRKTAAPRMGEIYDLSEKIEGIAPLPLFPTLTDVPEEKVIFVPLLGFEGTRFSHMFESVQPQERKTWPIIGVPGFRPEYPFSAYLGNVNPLQRSTSFSEVRFAKSNCPFSLYYTVSEISKSHEDHRIKLGLIGTKPHALGAILFAIEFGGQVGDRL